MKAETTKIVPNGWVRVDSEKPQCTDDGIFIEINGCHITIKENIDIELLESVCRILRSLSCTKICDGITSLSPGARMVSDGTNTVMSD